jgi:NTP pyrophosphatase (non-canonical NTP hydrolase)
MKKLTLNDYQEKAMSTCMPSCENISYMLLNLVGEVGEFASKIAKQIRKGNLTIGSDKYPNCLLHGIDMKGEVHDTINEELKKEAGDILWQLSGICSVMGWSLEDVAQMNLDKLAARKEAGTIDGSGDGIIRGK